MKCFLDKKLFDAGNHFFWDIPVGRVPHALLVGSSGSGKTYATKVFLARFAYTYPEATFLIGDYKADTDFAFLNGCKGFKRFDEVSELLTLGLKILENRQKGIDRSKEFVVICFDEFNAWQNSLDKKERDQAVKDYTRLIQLGRSFRIYVIISQQDAHKTSLGLSRDSIGTVIALGKLSKETVSMLFSDEKDGIVRNNPRGVGYMKIDGQDSRHILVPSHNMPPLERLIVKAFQRSEQYFQNDEAVDPGSL
ncbi:TPA: cell division protein FtsK [Streptococcus suis]|uniref:cell division protein FtsK n=1 Tax=Streptococcus TaxID=1301 RepID=UPI001961EBCC|nr:MULTISPECIES: cell division protein FtsK [Streptococcus]MBM7136128.1 cell division protein FtsK [Streptococcus suis]MBY0731139.1 cell division protein FtsK [Streptococcus sp. 2018162]MCO8177131.1 cell division protein FtsK [Streptococcus suis]MCO8189434.1 cell division protein FtsK [Streptococcus suis]MCO8205285.1 cell division protein FtsK [Streptococcus suis]